MDEHMTGRGGEVAAGTVGDPQWHRVRVLDADFDPLDHSGAVGSIAAAMTSTSAGWVATVNVAYLMMLRGSPELKSFVHDARWVIADGQPIVWLSRVLGRALPERVTGIDLIEGLCGAAEAAGLGVYVLGARPDVLERAAERLRQRYTRLRLECADGYFPEHEAQTRAREIASSNSALLIVGMGVPRQERFIRAHWDILNVGVAVGVGGSLDVIAGLRRRAPLWMQRSGLEWAFRLIQEPGRLWKRYLVTNSQFVLAALRTAYARGVVGGQRQGRDPHSATPEAPPAAAATEDGWRAKAILFGSGIGTVRKLWWGTRVAGVAETVSGLRRLIAIRRAGAQDVSVPVGAGGKLVLKAPSELVPVLVIFGRIIDPEYELLSRIARRNWVYWDVGAAVGQFTLFSALSPAKEVYSFEPDPRSARSLRVNLKRNDIAGRVQVHEVVLGVSHGYVNFPLQETPYLGRPNAASGTLGAVRVPSTTVDAMRESLGVAHIDVMKINVAGYEPGVLAGASATLSSGRVSMLIIMVTEPLVTCLSQLVNWRYRLFYYCAKHARLEEIRYPVTGRDLFWPPTWARHILAVYGPDIDGGFLGDVAVARVHRDKIGQDTL